MAEEENKIPEETTDEELEAIAESVPAPDEYPEGQAEELEESLPEDANVLEEAIVEATEVSEDVQDSGPAKAFDAGVSAIQEAIESTDEAPHEYEEHHHGDTTVIFGREYPVPVYTAVFGALAVLTIIEVAIAEIIGSDIKIPLLLALAVAKALLVVIFYMHLQTDSRVFAITLLIPVVVGLISALFLIAVPTGY